MVNNFHEVWVPEWVMNMFTASMIGTIPNSCEREVPVICMNLYLHTVLGVYMLACIQNVLVHE